MANIRDDFSEPMKKLLASRVGYRCSNPDCRKLTSGPSSKIKEFVNIGVAAHITAAAKGGKRYDPALSSCDRKDYNNGIWLCQNCAKLIDSDDRKFTVKLIKSWKYRAENHASKEVLSISPMHAENTSGNEWSPHQELFSCQSNLMYSEYFVGRARECSELMSLVDDGSKVLISGMGGIGKTELARWVYQQCLHRDAFCHVGFLTYRESIDATLVSAINPPNELPQEGQTAWAWNALHGLVQREKVLLVVDEVNQSLRDDPSLQRLLNLSCAVVLASRRRTMGSCKSLPIYALKPDDGISLFEDIYGAIHENEKDILATIVQKVAYCHPLTIKILASIGKSRSFELPELFLELETRKFTLAYVEDGEPIKLAEEYHKLFELADLSESEVKTLECFSILPYVQFPKKYCNALMQEDAGDTQGIALSMLAQKNWLEESDGSYAMHPLIAETICFSHPFSAKQHLAFFERATNLVTLLDNDALLQEAIPHTSVVLAIAGHYIGVDQEKSIFLCLILAEKYYQATRYKLAADLLEGSLALAKQTQKWGLCDLVLYHLCAAYIQTGKYMAAYEIALSLVNDRKLFCKDELIQIGEAYHILGTAERYLGFFEDALDSMHTAMEYYQDYEGGNDYHLSNLLGDIGGAYLDLGDFENARMFMQEDINTKERLGSFDIELAVAYNNIADFYIQTKNYDLAEQNLLKSAELVLQHRGEQSQHLGSVYNNLANLYHSLRQDDKALNYIRRSIDIMTVEFENHPQLSISYNAKAGMLYALGRTQEALRANDIAHAMLLKTVGEKNTTMGIVELLYASIYSDLRDYTEALPHAQRACENLMEFYAHDNPYLIHAQICLGESLSYTGDLQGALDALSQVEQSAESDHLAEQNLRSVQNLVRIYTELGRHEKALQKCIKALQLSKKVDQPKEAISVIFDKLLLCYSLSGRKEEKFEQWLKKNLKDKVRKPVNRTQTPAKNPEPLSMDFPRFACIDADPLELAYVMLSSGLYYNCELSWQNPDPKLYDERYILPRDNFHGTVITNKTVGTFADLCQTRDALRGGYFYCVCAIDKHDTERISLIADGRSGEENSLVGVHLRRERPAAEKLVNRIVKDLKTKHNEIFP